MRPARGRYRRSLVVAAALALGLTGCAGGGDYSAQTASTLQHGVLAVATAAEVNDLAGAQTRLAALAKLNDAALAKGEISSARHAAIESSIVLQQQLQQLQQQQDQKGKGKGKDKGDGHGGDG